MRYPKKTLVGSRRLRAIRAVAVSAPDWIGGTKSERALNSTDPASLFNACRYAADLAQRKIGAWSDSNWSAPTSSVREFFLLMYSLDDIDRFTELILSQRPNLLLLGAMTLCMPGAVECAKRAKELLADEVLIVLGGRHATETMYLQNERVRNPSTVCHHKASPGRLIREKTITSIFDIIVSGDGEHIIAEIGSALCNSPPTSLEVIADKIRPETPGNWIVDFPTIDRTVVSNGAPLRYDDMPSIARIFGVSASFDVFDGRMTSHVFSDTGRGCVYDCSFCSERRMVTGGIQDIKGAPRRLYRQLRDSAIVIGRDYPNHGASAFVEDSIFLSGSPVAIGQFCDLMEYEPVDIVFGGQFTIDQILRRKALIERLAKNGLRYVFVGLETFEPAEIGGMSKDLDKESRSWQDRFAAALSILRNCGISCGCALLFGLGEKHASRLALLKTLIGYRKTIGQPVVVSANWAVQHPLRNIPEGANEDYLRWGTPEGPLLNAFHRFGEASLEYPISGVAPPIIGELEEIINLLDEWEAINV
jgi:B12-binding domain/radical SAM domain protein